jgi:hypothetical protein
MQRYHRTLDTLLGECSLAEYEAGLGALGIRYGPPRGGTAPTPHTAAQVPPPPPPPPEQVLSTFK